MITRRGINTFAWGFVIGGYVAWYTAGVVVREAEYRQAVASVRAFGTSMGAMRAAA